MKNNYRINGTETTIYAMSKGIEHGVLIDTEDLSKVLKLNNSIYISNHGYACIKFKRKGIQSQIQLHRFLLGLPEGMGISSTYVDHINGNKIDNRKSNLREVSNSQNQQNRKGPQANSSTGFRNVYWHSGAQKWMVRLMVNKKSIYVGLFDTIEEAEKEAIKARKKYMPYSSDAMSS